MVPRIVNKRARATRGHSSLLERRQSCYQPRAMAHDLLIVSDVHLTDGRRPAADEQDLVPELIRFLESHARHPKPGRHYRLVANGDLFDFLHVRLRPGEATPFALRPSEQARGPGTSEEKSLWKLERILDANGPFLEALSAFLRAGNEVVILPGNHDLELHWPAVRGRLREVLLPPPTEPAHADVSARLRFEPWVYYEPGIIYVEHGSQYDGDNRVPRWLAPEVPDEPGVLELSAGAVVNRYFTHRLGLGPFVGDTSQSALGYALWMIRQFGIFKYFILFGWYLSFCWRVVTWAGRDTPATRAADARHRQRRDELEAQLRMPRGAMATIEAAAPPTVMSTRWRMLDRTMLPRVVLGMSSVAAALAILILGGWTTGAIVAAALTVALPMAFLTSIRHTYTGVADRHYPAAAAAARQALGVRHVAFGHQHIARAERADEGDARYFNLGCWIEGEGFERVPLHYLEVKLDGAEPVAELRRWPSRASESKQTAVDSAPSVVRAQAA